MEPKNQLTLYCVVCVVYVLCAVSGMCSVSTARFNTTLRNESITEGKDHGYDWFECGYSDHWVSGFTGTKEGHPVQGTVCCGIFAGCEVRWP